MALPMLVGSAECGPSNPLQSLSKRVDQDRGIQQVRETMREYKVPSHSLQNQDFFGLGRTGSSKQVSKEVSPASAVI